MNATSVASSGQMFSPFSQKTQSSSQAFNPFAPRPANEGASFGLDGASDSNWAKKNKRKNKFADSDNEGKLKVNNPFKNKDGNLSDSGKHRKRGGDGDKKTTDSRKNPKKQRDGPNQSRHQNGHGINGVHHAISAGEDNDSRPASSSGASSAGEESDAALRTNDPFAKKVYDRLRKDGISPPSWPSQPGNPNSKSEMSKFREKYEEYRKKVRASLTKAGLIDDPNKRKTLQDAIEFRGICEDMCPEYEKITRITEADVPHPEKDKRPAYPNTRRMVKKLARSAAGQEAPLPMDVRSPATLRRTLDYLIDDLLRNDANLPGLHGFLWDRTRAIRRDFTFFSSPTAEDMKIQAYILENVARFHVTALHLLSQPGKAGEDFVEQQELEQLGKALLSLRDLYDDCNALGIACENEAEFRAYYLVFHAHDSNTMEMLQRQWKPHFWLDSDEIRTAVSLAEALQNILDFNGPLKHAPFLAASSAFHSFFRIVEDSNVSYTMACFAECHFPQLRRSILRAVKRGLARPKESTNDVTAETLNKFLRFDTIQEAIDFAKLHDLEFAPDPQAPADAGKQLLILNNKGPLPCPRLQHQFSHNLVEKKRGKRRLPDVIHQTVYEDPETSRLETNGFSGEPEESLFVQDSEPETFEPAKPKISAASSVASPLFPSPSSQTPSGLGNSLAGRNQTSTPSLGIFGGMKSQPTATQSNPFGTVSSSPGSATATNPFASKLPSNNSIPNSPFTPASTPSGGAVSANPFANSALKGPLAGLLGPQSKEPAKLQPQPANTSSEKPNPFKSFSPLSTNGNTPLANPPFAVGGTPGENKPATPSFLAPSIKVSSESKPPAPSPVAAETQDGPKPSMPSSFTPSSGLVPTNAAGSGLSPSVPSITLTPSLSPSTVNGGQALGLNSTTLPAGPALPKFGVGSTPPQFPPLGTTLGGPFSGLLGSKTTTDPKLSTSSSNPIFTVQKQPEPQPLAQSQADAPVSQSPSATSMGLKTLSTTNLAGSVSSTTPPTSPPGKPSTLFQQAKPPPPVASPPRDLMGDFTKWFVKGDSGLMHDFEVFMLETILTDVYEKFKKDSEAKRRQEEEERLNAEAKKFRVYNLSLKYFYRWKENAREKRLRHLRRSGREQFRAFYEAQRAAQLKEEQEAARRAAKQKAELAALNRPEELSTMLKTSQKSKRKAEDALLASGVLSGVENEREAIATIVRRPRNRSPSLSTNGDQESRSRSGSIASTREGSKTRALREKLLGAKPGRFRRSLPSLSPGASSSPDRSPRVSKVSERWKLKAMGIVQMPDGTALPEFMADEIRRGLKKDPSSGRSSSVRRASVAGATRNESHLSSSREVTGSASMDGTNKRKRTAEDDGVATQDGESDTGSHKRVMSDAENLIKELRAMREEMEESTNWFKAQNGRLQSEILSRGGTPLDESCI